MVRSYVAAVSADAFVAAPVVAGISPAWSREPFTVTNDPVSGAITDTMARKTCVGRVVQPWPGPEGGYYQMEAVLYRGPDGKPWVKFYWAVAVSAQWVTPPVYRNGNTRMTHYAAWPDGDKQLTGTTIDPYGTFELACN